jgi:hypothetical protein
MIGEEAIQNNMELGVEVMEALNLSESERYTPETDNKITEITDFLGNHPDPLFILEMTKHNKGQMSNLEFLLGYINLNKQKIQKQKELDDIVAKMKFYEM